MTAKPQCVWILFADETTSFPPRMSFIGLRDRVFTDTLPWEPKMLNVITFWRGEPNTRFEFTLRVTGPDGAFLTVPSNRGVAQIGESGSFEVMELDKISLPVYGRYDFSILSDNGQVLFSEPFDVVKS